MKLAARMAILATLFAVGTGFSGQASAEYPEGPVTIVVPYPAGGLTDLIGRRLQESLHTLLGQPIVIDNRPGAAGHIGSAHVARAEPDGYTLLMQSGPTMAIGDALYAEIGYDPTKDLRSVAPNSFSVEIIVSKPDFPANNVQELIAMAKKNPGKITYSSPGLGTVGHLTAELLKSTANIDLLHVPYKGSAPAVLALLQGEVDLYFSNVDSSIGDIRSGRMKVLGNATLKRHPLIPDVATLDESGLKGFSSAPWFGTWAPARTPDTIVNRINKAMREAQATPEVRKALEETAQYAESLTTMTPSEMDKFMDEEMDKWEKAVKNSGLYKSVK